MVPRGIRNNNPGNLENDGDPWQGLVPGAPDPRFCQFMTPELGLRALMKTLLNYYRRHGLDTVQAMINRWAPPSENDTMEYQRNVALHLGVAATDVLKVDDPPTLIRLAQAIALHENGRPPKDEARPEHWYADAVYATAAKLALQR